MFFRSARPVVPGVFVCGTRIARAAYFFGSRATQHARPARSVGRQPSPSPDGRARRARAL